MPNLACIFNLLLVSVPTATVMLSTINSTSSNATAESTLHRSLHPDPAPCGFPVPQRHEVFKEQCLALQAIHSPHARYSSPGAPSTNRSKSMQSARCSKDSLQRKRLTDYQQVLPWQVPLTVNLDLQASNSGTSFAEKQDMRTCDTPAHCWPPTI